MDFDFPEPKVIGAGATTFDVLEFKANLNRQSLNIDREDRTIDNVILAQVGEARGHGVEIEQEFIDNMNSYVTKKMGGRVQCNFGHRWDSLGFQLGQFGDVRVDGKKFVGKLNVYKAADKSPEMKGMAEWFFDIAEEDPRAVTCSIKFVPKHYYQYDEKGRKVIINYSWWSGPQKIYSDKPAFVAFDRLISCDIVDNGALTDSLFSDGDVAAARTFADLVSAPGFKEFLRDNHEHFPQLSEFYQEKYKVTFGKIFNSFFSKNHKESMDTNNPAVTPAPTPPAPPVEASATPAAPVAENTDINAVIAAALKPLQDQIKSLQDGLATKDARIKELEGQPAAETVGVKDDNPSRTEMGEGNVWENDPVNRKAKGFHSKN